MVGANRVRHGVLWFALATCLAAGAYFRFHHLDRQVFWYDEIHTQLWASGQSWVALRERIPTVEMPARALQAFLQPVPGRGLREVVQSIAADDPQHTPLYYLLAHGWMKAFGASVWTSRALSAVIGLCMLPCMYWLTRLLGITRRTPYIALALVSVSPFFVIYSQEARQYGLLAVEVLLAGCLLLRAVRSGRATDWLSYGTSLIAGLYTHLLFAPVIASHAIYLFACFVWPKDRSESGKAPIIPFLGTVLVACLAIVPWVGYLISNMARATSHLRWSDEHVSPLYLMGMWGYNYSSLFLDTDHSVRFVQQYDLGLVLDYAFRAAIVLVIAGTLAVVSRAIPYRPRVFILSLVVVPFLALAVPDLLLGGIRSGGGHRFLIPSYLGIMVAVAAALGLGFDAAASWARRSVLVLAALLCAGIVSLTVHASANTWWTKPVGYHLPRMASIVSQSPRPLLISGVSVNLLSMSYLLPPTTQVLPVRHVDQLRIPEGYADIFVLEPSPALKEALNARPGFRLTEIDRDGRLWSLRPARQSH